MRWRNGTALVSTRVTFTHSTAISTSPDRTPSREYLLSLPLSHFFTFCAIAAVGRWNEEACWVPTLFQAQPRGVNSVWQPETLSKLCWAGRVELGGPAWRPAVIRKSFHSQMGKFCQHIVHFFSFCVSGSHQVYALPGVFSTPRFLVSPDPPFHSDLVWAPSEVHSRFVKPPRSAELGPAVIAVAKP